MDPKEYKKIYNKISSNIKEELNTRVANIVKELKKANYKNKDIHKRVEKSKEQILEVNKELSGKISDLKNVHEWNKYTIAFFGETNAGKSTVIEALRISLKENLKAKEYKEFEKIVAKKEILDTTIIKTKAKKDFYKDKNKLFYGILLLFIGLKYWLLQNRERRILKKLAKFKDGEIIGTGIQDFTQSCIDYNFSHNGKEYTLIDVPGIEGNEGKYEDMILQAVSRAHTVFYVVSGKIPESGTVQKIKKYLKQQAEVYCIINERRNKYFPEDAQKSFQELHYNDRFTQEVNQKMQEVLGGFYKGSVTVQALLAFYGVSKTIPYSRNEKYIKNKSKLLTIFDKEEKLVEKSNISSIANLILTELNNADVKIYNINIDKIIACIDFFAMKVKEVRDENYSDYLIEQINQQVISTNRKISNVEDLSNGLKHREAQIVRDIFNNCKEEINQYIDKFKINREQIKLFCENTIKLRIKEIINLYEEEVQQQRECKKNNINKEIEFLSDRINDLQRSNANESVNISYMPKIEIPKIEIKGKFVGIGMSVGAFFGPWGPVIGAAIGAVIEYLVNIFGGEESRKAKIKNNISVELDKIRGHILNEIGNSRGEIIAEIKKDIIQPVIEENKQVVVRYRNMQNMFNENIKFLNNQKNNLENEKHRYY